MCYASYCNFTYAIVYSLENTGKKTQMRVIRCRHNFFLTLSVSSFVEPTKVELPMYKPKRPKHMHPGVWPSVLWSTSLAALKLLALAGLGFPSPFLPVLSSSWLETVNRMIGSPALT